MIVLNKTKAYAYVSMASVIVTTTNNDDVTNALAKKKLR
jgi:hypothetical protein